MNPGAAAENDLTNFFVNYREQWTFRGFKNAPKNLFLSVNTPVSIAETKHGLGIVFSNNEAGLFVNNSVLLQYSYKMNLLDGVLGLGLNLGVIWQSFDWNEVDLTGGMGKDNGNDYHQEKESDPGVLSSASEGGPTAFDAGFGAFFSNKKMYLGLSALHLTAPNMSYDGLAKDLYIPRIFYLTGGYNISLSNTLYTLKPSSLIKTDFNTFQAELTGLLEYDKKIQGGMSYRFQDALVFMLGVNLYSGVYVNCAYDLPVSRMITSGGSFEVSVRYSFKLELARKSKYKATNIL